MNGAGAIIIGVVASAIVFAVYHEALEAFGGQTRDQATAGIWATYPQEYLSLAGGLVDLEFVAQYLQLVYAAKFPDILDTSTARVLDKAWRLGVLATEDAEVLRPAVRLYHDLTQVLRLCLDEPFDAAKAPDGLKSLLARAGDTPDFRHLEAELEAREAEVAALFDRLIV